VAISCAVSIPCPSNASYLFQWRSIQESPFAKNWASAKNKSEHRRRTMEVDIIQVFHLVMFLLTVIHQGPRDFYCTHSFRISMPVADPLRQTGHRPRSTTGERQKDERRSAETKITCILSSRRAPVSHPHSITPAPRLGVLLLFIYFYSEEFSPRLGHLDTGKIRRGTRRAPCRSRDLWSGSPAVTCHPSRRARPNGTDGVSSLRLKQPSNVPRQSGEITRQTNNKI